MSHLNPDLLQNFIHVYGNQYQDVYFLALRSKYPIFFDEPLDPTLQDYILVQRGEKCFKFIWKHLTLVFMDVSDCIPDMSVHYFLIQFIPQSDLLYRFYYSNVLYLVTRQNPFHSLLQKCRKSLAYHALCRFWETRQSRQSLTLVDITQLRFFKRYDGQLERFNSWSPFVFELCWNACVWTTYASPSACLGRKVHAILKRSESDIVGPMRPSLEFYQCEILMTDSMPVGVAFRLAYGPKRLEYVSPMVVSKPHTVFRDVSSVICNRWLPLYQNPAAWHAYGINYYVNGLSRNKKEIKWILDWLRTQRAEKYQHLFADLTYVGYILWGEEYEWTSHIEEKKQDEVKPV